MFFPVCLFAQSYSIEQLDSIADLTKEVLIPTCRNSNGDYALKTISAGALINKAIAPVPIVKYLDGNGTYTPTLGLKYIVVELVGGGGAGGGSLAGTIGISVGDGGGGGGHLRCHFDAYLLDPAGILCFVGVGGSASVGGTGGTGGNTLFGSLAVAYGGSGGAIMNPYSLVTASGAGSIIFGGSTSYVAPIYFLGSSGANNSKPSFFSVEAQNEVVYILPGQGGDSPFGAGGVSNRVIQDLNQDVAAVGVAGAGYGSGGSGAYRNGGGSAKAGGAGRPGYIVITEYF